jgi:hypothetical protein
MKKEILEDIQTIIDINKKNINLLNEREQKINEIEKYISQMLQNSEKFKQKTKEFQPWYKKTFYTISGSISLISILYLFLL